jgi:hypothetical protein
MKTVKAWQKNCVFDLPNLLKAENLDNLLILLSHLIESLLSNAEASINFFYNY